MVNPYSSRNYIGASLRRNTIGRVSYFKSIGPKVLIMVRIGIVGTGWISYSFATAAVESDKFAITAVLSRDEERAQRFQKSFPTCRVFTDYDALLESDLIDAVYVASPNSFHYAQSKAALENGKHVICEKPVCENEKQFDELISLADNRGLIVFEAYKTAYLPQLRLVKAMLQQIGPVRGVHLNYCQRSSKLDQFRSGFTPNVFLPGFAGGSLMDIGFYGVSLALELFGSPAGSSGRANLLSTGVDGSGSVTMDYEEFDVLIRHSKLFQSDIDSEISGDLGSIRIASISNLESIKLRMTGKESTDQFASEGNMRHEAEMFHEMIESGRGTRDDLLRSAGVIRVMQNIRLSNGILFPSDSHA